MNPNIPASQNRFKCVGPREYLVAEIVPSTDSHIAMALQIPDDFLFVQVWTLVVQNSFPYNTTPSSNGNGFQNITLAGQGEHEWLENQIRTKISDSLRLIPIPRTLYELCFLVLYVYDRVETRCHPWPPLEEDTHMDIPESFNYDHTLDSRRISINGFMQSATKCIEKSAACAKNLNWFCLLVFIHLQKKQILDSIFDIDPNCNQINIDRQSSSGILELNEEDAKRWTRLAISSLQQLEVISNQDISKRYQLWPLTSPLLQTYIQEEEIELWKTSLELVFEDLQRLLVETKKGNNDCVSLLSVVQNKCFDSSSPYSRIIQTFCPALLESQPNRSSRLWRQKLLQSMELLHYVDPLVNIVRRTGSFRDELASMLLEVVEMEMKTARSDFTILFRATTHLDYESFITKIGSHESNSIQFRALGSTSDYSQGDTNPFLAHSMSFANSIFAGIMYDPTACIWNYLSSEPSLTCYCLVLPISQSSQTDPSVASLEHFWISPIPTLIGIAGIGDLFHSRSKTYLEKDLRDSSSCFVTGIINCSYKRLPDFLLSSTPLPRFNTLPIQIIKRPTLTSH